MGTGAASAPLGNQGLLYCLLLLIPQKKYCRPEFKPLLLFHAVSTVFVFSVLLYLRLSPYFSNCNELIAKGQTAEFGYCFLSYCFNFISLSKCLVPFSSNCPFETFC